MKLDFDTTALLLTWAALLLLSCVMAGMVRQLHALSGGRTASIGSSVGPGVGQLLTSPLPAPDGESGRTVLLFADTNCASCADAARFIGPAAAVVTLFRQDAPVEWPTVALGDQGPLFDELRIGPTPFAVAVSPSRHVLAARGLGSPTAAHAFLEDAGFEAPAAGPHLSQMNGT